MYTIQYKVDKPSSLLESKCMYATRLPKTRFFYLPECLLFFRCCSRDDYFFFDTVLAAALSPLLTPLFSVSRRLFSLSFLSL